MAFTSLSFLILVAITVVVYYVFPKKLQWAVLLAASLAFYCIGGGKTVLYVFYTATTVYAAGLLLGYFNGKKDQVPKEQRKAVMEQYKKYRQLVVLFTCLANFVLLYILKYWNFTAELFQPLVDRFFHGAQIPLSSLLLPLGVMSLMYTAENIRRNAITSSCCCMSAFFRRWYRDQSAGSMNWHLSCMPSASWIIPI